MPPAAPIETAATMPPSGPDTAAPPLPHSPRSARKRKPEPRRGLLLVLPSARTGQGKRLREFRAGLIEHVGKPSLVQLALIDRATVLQHHLVTMDRQAAAAGGMSEHAQRRYLAWDGSLRRALLALGLEAAPPPVVSLADRLAASPSAAAWSRPPGPVQPPGPVTAPPAAEPPMAPAVAALVPAL